MKTRKLSAVDLKPPSLASGPIQSLTSWYAKVLHNQFGGNRVAWEMSINDVIPLGNVKNKNIHYEL